MARPPENRRRGGGRRKTEQMRGKEGAARFGRKEGRNVGIRVSGQITKLPFSLYLLTFPF